MIENKYIQKVTISTKNKYSQIIFEIWMKKA